MDLENEALYTSELKDLVLNDRQWTLYPIKYPEIFDLAKRSIASFWTVEEVDFSVDLADMSKLTSQEYTSLLVALGFFAQADGLVMENVSGNFMPSVALPEAQYFYAMQMAMEAIHSEAYSLMLDTYLSNSLSREEMLKKVQNLQTVKRKNEWAINWMNSEKPFVSQVIAFCCVEAIFFSSSFALIFYFRKRGLLPGLSQANDYISRDEGLHVEFGSALIRILDKKPSQEYFSTILKSAVEVECSFVDELLAEPLPGFNSESLQEHVKSQADMLAELCGYMPVYNKTSPFEFMRMQIIPGKTNFFEKRPSEYRKSVEKVKFEESDFCIDSNF